MWVAWSSLNISTPQPQTAVQAMTGRVGSAPRHTQERRSAQSSPRNTGYAAANWRELVPHHHFRLHQDRFATVRAGLDSYRLVKGGRRDAIVGIQARQRNIFSLAAVSRVPCPRPGVHCQGLETGVPADADHRLWVHGLDRSAGGTSTRTTTAQGSSNPAAVLPVQGRARHW
jgi:hypothetical protein